MTIRIQASESQVWTVAPSGRIDQPAARAIEEALSQLRETGRTQVVVDLSGVAYVASAGLATLLMSVRQVRLLHGDVRLCCMNERVREVFEMSGFDQVFAIYPTAEQAAASYRPGAGSPAA